MQQVCRTHSVVYVFIHPFQSTGGFGGGPMQVYESWLSDFKARSLSAGFASSPDIRRGERPGHHWHRRGAQCRRPVCFNSVKCNQSSLNFPHQPGHVPVAASAENAARILLHARGWRGRRAVCLNHALVTTKIMCAVQRLLLCRGGGTSVEFRNRCAVQQHCCLDCEAR